MKESILENARNEDNTELISRIEIEDSPFTVIVESLEGQEQKIFGTIGRYRITEPMDSVEEVKELLSTITWNRIVQVMLILIETQVKK